MKPTPAQTSKQKSQATQSRHALMTNLQNQKFRPASRGERLASWDRRMQSLFTRQAY